jgi:hypothetical protein
MPLHSRIATCASPRGHCWGCRPSPRTSITSVPTEGFILGTRLSAAIAGRRRCSTATTIILAETAAGSTGKIDWSQAWSSAGGGTRLASSAATHRRHATTATDAANRSLSGTPAECSADAKPAQRAVRCDGMIYCAARCEIRAMRCDEMR